MAAADEKVSEAKWRERLGQVESFQAGCMCRAVCWLGMLSELLQHKRSSAPGGVTQTASVGGKMAREQNW